MNLLYDTVHLINAICASLVLGLVILRGRRWYSEYSVREKIFHNAMVLYAFSAALISAEGFIFDHQSGVASFIILGANLYAIYGIIRYSSQVFTNVRHPRF